MNHVVRRVAPPVLLALVAAGLVAAPAGAAPTWVAPAVTLTQGTNPPEEPRLVVDAAGNATVAWVERVGPSEERHVQVSTHPVGGPWSAPMDISGSGDVGDFDIATNAAGHTVAVWSRGNGTNDVLEAATRPPGGGWSAPVPVGDPLVDTEAAQVVVDADGNAVATWIGEEPNALRWAAKPAAGTWSSADDVSDPALGIGIGNYDLVVTPDGQATAAWTQYVTADDKVIQTAVRPAGGTFSDPETVSSGDGNTDFPQVAVNAAGLCTVVWSQDTASADDDDVRAATRSAIGTWSAAEDVSASGGFDSSPDVVVDSAGTSTAVWTRDVANQPGHLLFSSRPAGGTWSQPQDLTPPSTQLLDPVLAIDASDRITAAYTEFAHVGSTVVKASTRSPGGPWTAAIPLSPADDGAAFETAVAMDAAGQATVVWLRPEAPPGYVLETRSLDTQGPLPTGLSLPAATAGTPVTLSWQAVDAWSPIASVAWSFGDGGTGSGPSLTRTFATAGSYAVSVTATDAVGYATTLTGTVVVSPAPPVTPPATPAPKPVLSGVKLTKKTIHVVGSDAKPRATKLLLALNVDATVVVKLKRTAKVNGKAVKAKKSKAMKLGQQAIRLTSKVGGKKLVAGTYRITVRATNAVGSSAVRTVKLKVLS